MIKRIMTRTIRFKNCDCIKICLLETYLPGHQNLGRGKSLSPTFVEHSDSTARPSTPWAYARRPANRRLEVVPSHMLRTDAQDTMPQLKRVLQGHLSGQIIAKFISSLAVLIE